MASNCVARWFVTVWLITMVRAAEPGLTALWEIGRGDRGNAEFALAPDGHGRFREDGFFVVGASDPKQDWPYVHPGPADTWAGSRRHTFVIVFGLSEVPAAGTCRLRLDFLDTHSGVPPTLRVEINGQPFERTLPAGAGDASILGDASKGKPTVWELDFPSSVLRAGDNEIGITSWSGSWALYDALSLATPAGARLGTVEQGIRITSVEAPPVWVKENGEPRQPVSVGLRSQRPLADARFVFEGREVGRSALRSGVQTVVLKLPPVNTRNRGSNGSARGRHGCWRLAM